MFPAKQAILPEDLEENTISAMLTGESAWTVPWGMWVDSNRECWLHPNYSVRSRPGGTVQMLVTRRADGFYVNIGRCNHKWLPSARPGYMSPEDTEYIPVVELEK